jgi:hypothetical protein
LVLTGAGIPVGNLGALPQQSHPLVTGDPASASMQVRQ